MALALLDSMLGVEPAHGSSENVPDHGSENVPEKVLGTGLGEGESKSKSKSVPEEHVSKVTTENVAGIDPGNSENVPGNDLANGGARQATSTATTTVNGSGTITSQNVVWDSRLPLPRPDVVSFGSVIDGCARVSNAHEAVRILDVMRKEGIGVKTGRWMGGWVLQAQYVAFGGSRCVRFSHLFWCGD